MNFVPHVCINRNLFAGRKRRGSLLARVGACCSFYYLPMSEGSIGPLKFWSLDGGVVCHRADTVGSSSEMLERLRPERV